MQKHGEHWMGGLKEKGQLVEWSALAKEGNVVKKRRRSITVTFCWGSEVLAVILCGLKDPKGSGDFQGCPHIWAWKENVEVRQIMSNG